MGTVVKLFSAPEIVRDGQPRSVDTRKAIAVLAYLAVEGPSVRRDRLAWLLWPDTAQERARAALRRTLTALRGAIGAEALAATRETITLERDHLQIDSVSFQRAIEAGDPNGAVDLYRGEFLEGFSLRDAPDFDDWQRLEVDGFRNRVDGALAALTDDRMAANDLLGAASHVLRRIELDPLNEEARRSLMLIYAQLGRRADAINEFRELVRVLNDELAVAPLPDTMELYEAIRRGEVDLAPHRAEPVVVREAPAEVPLVGRNAELARFDAALASGRGTVIGILGEPGVGKSTLLAELARHTVVQGRPLARARCFEGELGLAYAPVAALLRSVLPTTPDIPESIRPDLARLLPERHTSGESGADRPTDGPGARIRLFDAWAAALDGAPFDGGVLLLDDVDYADDATLDFLIYVANRIDDSNWLLVVTATTPVRPIFRAETEVLHLNRLDETAVARIAREMGITDERQIARAQAETGGLPALIAAYLSAAGEERPDLATLGLVDRLEALPQTARQVVEAAAVIDRAFDLDLIRDVVGRTTDEVAVAVDLLIAAGTLQPGPDDTFEPSLGALRDAAYGEVSPVRLRLLHERAAAVLEGKPRRQGEAAHHLELAGNGVRAATLHAAAAKDAMKTYAHADALTHLRSALALGHDDRAGLHELAGDVETLEGRYAEALRSYETAAAISDGDGLATLEHKLGLLHIRRGDLLTADSHLLSALTELDDDGIRSRILAARASAAERRGDLEAARALATEAVTAAECAEDVGAEASARGVAGVIALRNGEVEASRQLMRDSLRLAEVDRSSTAAAAAHNGLGLAMVERGKPDAAIEHFRAAVTLLGRLGDRHRQSAVLSNLADALHASGRPDEAMDQLKRSATLMADIGGDPLEGEAGVWELTSW